jgi:hypothetical protein
VTFSNQPKGQLPWQCRQMCHTKQG